MGRRKCQWTEADEAMWNAVYEITAEEREDAIERCKRRSQGNEIRNAKYEIRNK